jgi:hypothetical protein
VRRRHPPRRKPFARHHHHRGCRSTTARGHARSFPVHRVRDPSPAAHRSRHHVRSRPPPRAPAPLHRGATTASDPRPPVRRSWAEHAGRRASAARWTRKPYRPTSRAR